MRIYEYLLFSIYREYSEDCFHSANLRGPVENWLNILTIPTMPVNIMVKK